MLHTTTAVTPSLTTREHLRSAIRVLNSISGVSGATDTAHHLASMCTHQSWTEKNIRMACSGLRTFRTLLLHEANPEYWMNQIAVSSHATDAGYIQLASDIAEERLHQVTVITDALNALTPLLQTQ